VANETRRGHSTGILRSVQQCCLIEVDSVSGAMFRAEERGGVTGPSDGVDRNVVLGVVDCAKEGFIALGEPFLLTSPTVSTLPFLS